MTPLRKTLTGIIAFLPLIGGIILMAVYFNFIMHLMQDSAMYGTQSPEQVFPQFARIIRLMLYGGIPVMLVHFMVMVIYIIHAVNNRALPDGERVVWILLFVFIGAVAYPIYFFMRIAGKAGSRQDAVVVQ